jgi:transcriptional regulator with XRE-family HTH domain
MRIESDKSKIAARNIAILMDKMGMKEPDLVRKSGVSQRTINDLLDPERPTNPTLKTLEKIADALRVPVWRLLIPNQTAEQLLDQTVNELIMLSASLDTEAAALLLSFAKREARK